MANLFPVTLLHNVGWLNIKTGKTETKLGEFKIDSEKDDKYISVKILAI